MNALRPLARASLVALFPVVLASLVARWIPVRSAGDDGPGLVALLSGYTAAALVLLVQAARLPVMEKPSFARMGAGFVAGVVCVLSGWALGAHAAGRLWMDVAGGWLNSFGVILGAASLGGEVGLRIQHAGHLPAVVLMSSAADIVSVFSPRGLTHQLVVEQVDPVKQRLLTISAPVPPDPAPTAMLGFGDVLFAALYVMATRKFGLSQRRTVLALAAGLVLALAASLALAMPVPALPALGLCMLLAHREVWRIPEKDRRTTALAALVLVVVVVRGVRGWR